MQTNGMGNLCLFHLLWRNEFTSIELLWETWLAELVMALGDGGKGRLQVDIVLALFVGVFI